MITYEKDYNSKDNYFIKITERRLVSGCSLLGGVILCQSLFLGLSFFICEIRGLAKNSHRYTVI